MVIWLSLTILLFIISISPALVFTRYVSTQLNKKISSSYSPKVSIILPCCGLDTGFEENLNAVLSQDYASFEVVFVVAQVDDPAYPIITEIIRSKPHAKLVVAGIGNQQCAQKLHNQVKAVEATNSSTEILLFLDSDIRPASLFIKNIVERFQESDIGATYGYRWYVPPQGSGFWPIVHSQFNAAVFPFLVSPGLAFGGAMAMRKQTFFDVNLDKIWLKSLSDDFTLTKAVRQKGLKIQFIPQCLVPTIEPTKPSVLFEWSRRQCIIHKIYDFRTWLPTVLFYLAKLPLALMGIYYVFFTRSSSIVLTLGLLLLALADIIPIYSVLDATRKIGRHMKIDYAANRLFFPYLLALPASYLLFAYALISSLLSSRIAWRDIRYHLHSPQEIERY
ncbi:glycosyltransferase [Candidatus Omnitrophota bacterium]